MVRKVYIYKCLYSFFKEDKKLISDYLTAFFYLYSNILMQEDFNEIEYYLVKLQSQIIDIEKGLMNISQNEEKIIIDIYDADDVIKYDKQLFMFFGLVNFENEVTKMPNFSYFVNVFLFLLVKKINQKFAVNCYFDFEKKWLEYFNNLNLNSVEKIVYLSNNYYLNFVSRVYFLLFS